MAPDRSTAGLNRDNREQRVDVGGSTQTGSGSLEHKNRWFRIDFLAKPIPAGRHLLTWRRIVVVAVAALVLAAVWGLVIPWVQLTLNTVSTDDAFVNGHVTFVARSEERRVGKECRSRW